LTSLRSAIHVHSAWSYDAKVSLEGLADAFAGHGYQVVFMCEHDRGFSQERWDEYKQACEAASRPDVLLVPGIEYADPEDRVHIPVWGCADFLGEALPTTELLRRAGGGGGFAVLAHPARRDAWDVVDPAWYTRLGGIEVWTRKWDGWAPNLRASAVAEEEGLVPIVSLDLHRLNQFFPLAITISVDGAPSPATALAALRAADAKPVLRGLAVGKLSRRPVGDVLTRVERLRRPVVRLIRP